MKNDPAVKICCGVIKAVATEITQFPPETETFLARLFFSHLNVSNSSHNSVILLLLLVILVTVKCKQVDQLFHTQC